MGSKGNWQQRLATFMAGRNGLDDLARACLGFAVAAMVLQYFLGVFSATAALVFSVASSLLFLYVIFRMFSRNLTARRKENRGWVKAWTPILMRFRRKYAFLKDWKAYHREYHIVVCKQCGQTLKIPKGKGRIRVTCPKCRSVFERKS